MASLDNCTCPIRTYLTASEGVTACKICPEGGAPRYRGFPQGSPHPNCFRLPPSLVPPSSLQTTPEVPVLSEVQPESVPSGYVCLLLQDL